MLFGWKYIPETNFHKKNNWKRGQTCDRIDKIVIFRLCLKNEKLYSGKYSENEKISSSMRFIPAKRKISKANKTPRKQGNLMNVSAKLS